MRDAELTALKTLGNFWADFLDAYWMIYASTEGTIPSIEEFRNILEKLVKAGLAVKSEDGKFAARGPSTEEYATPSPSLIRKGVYLSREEMYRLYNALPADDELRSRLASAMISAVESEAPVTL